MQYRTLGRTGIKVSEIGLGCWELGGAYRLRERSSKENDPAGYTDVARDEALATIRFGIDHGLTFLDTAPIYGNGESERRVGQALRDDPERPFGPVTVETKLAVFADEGRYRRIFTRDVVLREFALSQERLQTDVIDIDLLHSPTRAEFGNGESLRALLDLKEAGKVRWIGISSSYDVLHTRELVDTGLLDVLQIPLSLLRPEWQDVLAACRKHQTGVVVREPLYSGYLTGRLTADTVFAPDDQRSVWGRERHLNLVRQAGEFAFLSGEQRTPAQAALKWILSFPEVATVIAGSANREELAANLAVSDQPALTSDELARAKRVHETVFAAHA